MGIRPLGVSCGVWHWDICSGSFGTCMLEAEASMDRTCSSTSHRCSTGLRSREFVGQGDALSSKSRPWSCSWAVFVVVGLIVLLGSALAINGVCYPQRCQDPWTVGRTLPCNEMINDTHITFNGLADRCIIHWKRARNATVGFYQ